MSNLSDHEHKIMARVRRKGATKCRIKGTQYILIRTKKKLYNFTKVYKPKAIHFIAPADSNHALVSLKDLKKLYGQVNTDFWSLADNKEKAREIIDSEVLS